jgi:hypothetical protein
MQQCINIFIIPYLYEARHVSGDTAHHQEPKIALAASGVSYVEGCWTSSWWIFHIYMKLNMFRVTHRPLPGA